MSERIVDRRAVLRGLGALGLMAALPRSAFARTRLGGPSEASAYRISRLTPANGLFLVHTDLHNHSLISGDAAGDPQTAYAQMRSKGIDVACLTEHAISGKDHGELTCPGHQQGGCHTIEGINSTDWEAMRAIADGAYEEGTFVAFRGFEWSTPSIGHLNVWFSEKFTDALHEHAFFTPRAIAEVDRVAPVPSEIVDTFEQSPELATMRFFYEWLASNPDRAVFGGGNDGLACFNHPNEFGNFDGFTYDPAAATRVVSCEALNADRDFFWYGTDEGMPNPLNLCLNAGWRVGFTGVSDEHGTEYGRDGMARGGLWVSGLSRGAVKDALASRRSFATFEHGLRLDATANGVPMGSAIASGGASIRIDLDLDHGAAWAGTKQLIVEVVTSGAEAPALAHTLGFSVPDAGQGPVSFDVPASAVSRWMFLRITDPSRPPDELAPEPFASHGRVVAYASPWFIEAGS